MDKYYEDEPRELNNCYYVKTIRQCMEEVARLRGRLNPIIVSVICESVEKSTSPKAQTEIERELENLLDMINSLNIDIRI